MLRRRPSLILFDLDGTLVDSAPDLAAAIDRMLGVLGHPPAGEEKVRGWIGHGLPQLVRRALTHELWPEKDPPDFERALALYQGFYREAMVVGSRVYPGVFDGLQALSAQHWPMACVTNKHSAFTRALLEAVNLLDFFKVTLSGDEVPRPKPDPMPLLKLAEQFKVRPDELLMVGDSEADARAARAAGSQLVLVRYGYHGSGGVERLKPDLLLDSLAELPAALPMATPPTH